MLMIVLSYSHIHDYTSLHYCLINTCMCTLFNYSSKASSVAGPEIQATEEIRQTREVPSKEKEEKCIKRQEKTSMQGGLNTGGGVVCVNIHTYM